MNKYEIEKGVSVKWFLGLIIVIALAAAVFVLSSRNPAKNTNTAEQSTINEQMAGQIISISDSDFSPGTLEIKAGETATFVNDGLNTHSVTSDNGIFDSGPIDAGSVYTRTFYEAGTYKYHCGFHPAEKGVIEVK